MTNLKCWQKLFLLLVMGFSLSLIYACGDDEEEPVREPEKEETLGIIGTWKWEYNSGDGYDLYYFDQSGYGWWSEGSYGDNRYKYYFSYTYDASSKKIIIDYGDDDVEEITVLMLSDETMILRELEDEAYFNHIYKRINEIEDETDEEKTLSIAGTWRYEFEGYIFLYFDELGYGWEKQYNDGEWYDDYFTYVYDNSTRNLTLEYSDGYITEMTVEFLSESVLVFDGFHEGSYYFCDRMSNDEYIPNNKDQNHKIKKDLTGTWRYEFDNGSLEYWYFDGFGKGWERLYEGYYGMWNDKVFINYVYNDSDGEILVYYDGYGNGYDMTHEIEFRSDNVIRIISSTNGMFNDDESDYLVRISNDEIETFEND